MASAEQQDHPPLNRKAVAAVILGNALEFYDFTTYTFFAKQIGNAYFPSTIPSASLLSSLLVFWIGFFTRPLGGVVIGAYSDRAGRKPAMVLTIALMAVGMLLLATTPGYATIGWLAPALVVLGRLIQGFALGGEVGPSTAYLLEAAPPARRGFFASWQIASQGVAQFLAGLVGFALASTLSDASMAAWGWRVPFLLGVAVVPIGLFIRRHLPETAGETADPGAEPTSGAVVARLLRDHGPLLTIMIFMIMAGTVSSYVGSYMPTYAQSSLGLSLKVSTGATMALGLAGLVFCLLGGLLCDRFGRKPVMIIPRAAIVLVAVPAFFWLVQAPSLGRVFTVTVLLSALSSVSAAGGIASIPEALPRAVRSAGLSIVYAFSVSIFGGSTQWAVTKLIDVTGSKLAPAYYLAAVSVIGVIAAALMPETKGRRL